jgi:general secretion pathway protein C
MDLSATQSASRAQDAVPQLLEQIEHWLSRRWVIIALNIALLILLTYSAAQWVWRLITPPVSDSAPIVALSPDTRPDFNFLDLIGANIFGELTPIAGPMAVEDIPLSSLNLTLTGIFATGKGGVALISADGGPETPIIVGQDIVAGATLNEVLTDRVLIRRGNGQIESLMLKDDIPALADGSIVGGVPPPAPVDTGIQQTGNNRFNISREQMNQQMQKPEFLRQALMTPSANGGFLVRELQPGSLYEKIGLRVGDVIHNVNGQPVNNMQDVMRLYQQLGAQGAAQVNVQVRRAGKTETIQYNIR